MIKLKDINIGDIILVISGETTIIGYCYSKNSKETIFKRYVFPNGKFDYSHDSINYSDESLKIIIKTTNLKYSLIKAKK